MHTLSKEVLSSDEMETLRRSRIPTTVLAASGEVQTSEEAQENDHDLNLFVTVQILDDTPAVVSRGKLCEEHGYTYEWASGQKPHLTKQGVKILCKAENFVPPFVPGLSSNYGTSLSFTSLPQDSSRTSASPATERSDDQAPGNWRDTKNNKNEKKKRGMTVENRETDCETFQKGYRSSKKILKIRKCQHPHTFLRTQVRNVLRTWHPGSTVCLLTSQTTENAKSACEPR